MKKNRSSIILAIALGLPTLWAGSFLFSYFTHQQKPHVSVQGLAQDGSYKGALACTLVADNGYKINTVSASLDGQPFDLNIANVRSKKIAHAFSIDTTALDDGKHQLVIEVTDASYKQNHTRQTWDFYVDNVALKATFLENAYSVDQGKTIHVKLTSNKKLKNAHISLLSGMYKCHEVPLADNTYECFVPIECEETPGEHVLTAKLEDAASNTSVCSTKATINKAIFKKGQHKYELSKKIADEKEQSMNSKILDDAIKKWVQSSPQEKLWSGAFEMPTLVHKIITPHGEIRVTPERGRYLHKGIDITSQPKTVIWAAQNGKVIIKDRFVITGNTVVIDHGLGVFTKYAHLEDFADIEVGDMIKKGNPLGRLGKTGYATGYHLHWELLVNGVAVDPLEWTKKVY